MDLSLKDNQIMDEGSAFIAKALPFSRIEKLDLGGNKIGDVGVISLASILGDCETLSSLCVVTKLETKS